MAQPTKNAAASSLSPSSSDLTELRNQLRQFAVERDWEQFHNPRSLLLALMGELGELAELFQWKTDQASALMDSPKYASRVREELADVFGYLVRLADILNVDLREALEAKIKVNAQRYPAERARGRALKFTELRD